MEEMRSWNDLGVVDTIYEEEQEDDSKCSSLTPSSPTASSHTSPHSSSSLLSSLQSRVEEWSRATGSKTDAVVRVHDQCFHLHKEPLVSRSRYLRRHLTESPVVAVSPPSTIAAETFAAVADFCYGSDISISPFNVAALRIAAEWLEMAEDGNVDWDNEGEGNLLERTEWYFCQAVAASTEYAAVVLRTCLRLLPDSPKTAAFLAGRCVEALAAGGGFEVEKETWLDDLVSATAEEFQLIADSIRARLPDDGHDLIYKIVDHYLQNYTYKITEEEKSRICCAVDCKKLSRQHLIHLVRNPRMPLRFVVQAMLVEQFHTRVSFFDRVCKTKEGAITTTVTSAVTLGTILQRDAAIRQAAHLKATMEATSFRIHSLERELSEMKRRLRESQEEEEEGEEVESAPARAASFRFFSEEERAKSDGLVVYSEEKSCNANSKTGGRRFGRKLIHGFKSVFRATMRSGSESRSLGCSGDGDVVPSEISRRTHRRNQSFA